MQIDFKRIEIFNFMSFSEEVFDFSAHKGLSLIQGKNNDSVTGEKNGCGKSNIGYSLLYALFGQLIDMKKNQNIVNRYTDGKEMRLALWLNVDGASYKIVRGILKKKNSYLNLYRIEDGTETDITKSSIAETQAYIEDQMLHFDISIFLRTILLTADQTYNFYRLSRSDKKDFVEKMFDLAVFGEMYSAMHKDLLALEKQMLSRQNQLVVVNGNIDEYRQREAKYKADSDARIDQISAEKSELSAKLETLKNTEIKTNVEEIRKYEAAIMKLESAKSASEDSFRASNRVKSEIAVKIGKLKSASAQRQTIIDKNKELMGKLCSDCRAVFSDYYNIGTYEKDVAKMAAAIDKLEKSSAVEEGKMEKLSSNAALYGEKIGKARERIKALSEKANQKNRALAQLEARIQQLGQEKSKLERGTNPYTEMLTESQHNAKLESQKLAEDEIRYKYLKHAENIVSQETLRKLIIKDLIVLLNNRVKMYLTKLGVKFYVQFDENMDYEFVTNGGNSEFGNFSAGEKMRIMIATNFAFRDFMNIRNGLNANVLIFDEYFDSAISSVCVQSVMNILKEYNRKTGQNIYCISHRSEVSEDEFDRIIQVEKTNDISRIRYL